MFLGQRGATKLAAGVGFELPEILQYPHPDMYPHPEGHDRQGKEPEVSKFYETCGVYLGYGLAQNIEF